VGLRDQTEDLFMRRTHLTATLLLAATAAAIAAPALRHTEDAPMSDVSSPREPTDPAPVPEPTPQLIPEIASGPVVARASVELVFVLDTTGSMSGLIEGAKSTIWSVVNDFSSQTPRPDVKVGLVAYRDRGDAYVSQVHPLTSDLDSVYQALTLLRAGGGGDTPESVAKGLQDSIHAQPWSYQQRTYRSVFVVGDAPDKGYSDESSLADLAKTARELGIYVSAIRCGGDVTTATQFAQLAEIGGGVFTSVAQHGAAEVVVTPMDAELQRLHSEMGETAMLWGSDVERQGNASKIHTNKAAPSSSIASRLSVLSKGGHKVVTSTGKGDYLDDLGILTTLEETSSADLPAVLRDLTPQQRQHEVDIRMKTREDLRRQIDELVISRDGWLAEERNRLALSRSHKAYDREVVDHSINQLKALGYIE
jgi:Mg-chelatase subunit ChlD